MRAPRSVVTWLAALSIATSTRAAFSFGGTARELEHQGNFAITNDADFAFAHEVGHGDTTTFGLRPGLDYFVVRHLSIGGAVEFQYQTAPGNGPSRTRFTVAPQIGYEIALSDSWSFWPTLSTPISFPNPGDPTVAVVVFAPFLVHPAEHFFLGIGPGFSQGLTSNPTTFITGGFLIGGYFDH